MKIKNENEVITIEQKAQRYDEVFTKAAALYKASEPMSGCNVIIETLFPELAESEDEKVRKELIKHLKELSDWKEDEVIPVKNPSYYRQWDSWLEKQGQVKESTISQHENRTCLTSEDEKVRKALIDFFGKSAKYGGQTNGVYDKDILAWLEKQGGKKPFTIDIDKMVEKYAMTRQGDFGMPVNCQVKAYRQGINDVLRLALNLEKQGEHKPAIEMKSVEESLGIDSDTYNKIVDECIFGEQKPEENKGNIGGISPNWSEEEEHYIRQLESMVKERWALAEKAQDEEVIKNMSNLAFFLKTLNPNKKPADEDMKTLLRTEYEKGRADAIAEMQKDWSEEDEIYYKRVQLSIEWARAHNRISEGSCDEQLNWLKSLRPQNRWKPSEEQIKVCKEVYADILSAKGFNLGTVNSELNRLEEELKKLKK